MILITGHRGFIGSYLFAELSKSHDVTGLDIKDGQDIHRIRDFPPAAVVFHLAAQTSVIDSVSDPLQDATDNILMTIRILRAYPNAKIIYTASGGASEQEELGSPYGLSKMTGGHYLNLLHQNVVICNLSNVFGPGGKGVIERFLSEPVLTIYGSGNQTRDFVYVEDMVEGLIKAMDWPAGVYFMGAGREVSVKGLVEATNKTCVYVPKRKGEIERSVLTNTTPNWKPKVDVIDYLREKIHA